VDAAASGANEIAGRVSRERPSRARRTTPKPGEAFWRRRVAAYGKTVWSWHPLLVSNRRRCCEPNRARQNLNPPMTVTRRIRRRGEHGISRKTIAQGRRNAPTVPVCSCALAIVFGTRDRGCSKHPAFPAPSSLWANDLQGPGERCRGNAEVCFVVIASEAKQSIAPRKGRMDCFVASLLAMTWISRRHTSGVIAREGGRSSIPETAAIEPRSRGVLDPPHARGMTAQLSLREATCPP
jgi:hypothetical protein